MNGSISGQDFYSTSRASLIPSPEYRANIKYREHRVSHPALESLGFCGADLTQGLGVRLWNQESGQDIWTGILAMPLSSHVTWQQSFLPLPASVSLSVKWGFIEASTQKAVVNFKGIKFTKNYELALRCSKCAYSSYSKLKDLFHEPPPPEVVLTL